MSSHSIKPENRQLSSNTISLAFAALLLNRGARYTGEIKLLINIQCESTNHHYDAGQEFTELGGGIMSRINECECLCIHECNYEDRC